MLHFQCEMPSCVGRLSDRWKCNCLILCFSGEGIAVLFLSLKIFYWCWSHNMYLIACFIAYSLANLGDIVLSNVMKTSDLSNEWRDHVQEQLCCLEEPSLDICLVVGYFMFMLGSAVSAVWGIFFLESISGMQFQIWRGDGIHRRICSGITCGACVVTVSQTLPRAC